MDWDKIKQVLAVLVDYFKKVFAYWYPAEDAE